ncbi:MAG: diheme cytochrome c [Betaproteobacteria bacterium]|nr:diheme cytochrome c [Betaproteobacteria bacterium]
MKQTLCRLACLGFLLLPMSVFAGGGKHGGGKFKIVQAPESYVQECASCHVGYQPGLLPARSWQNIMSGLEQHYGEDASLEPELVQILGAWLRDNAAMSMGRGMGKDKSRRFSEAPPEDRITKAAWFSRKHRKIDKPVWRMESVKSAANCEACHTNAGEGYFNEKDLTIPEGLSWAQKRAFWH